MFHNKTHEKKPVEHRLKKGEGAFTPALGRKPEEVIASDLVAGGFPADVGEGWVNLSIPLVSAIEYVYLGRQVHRNATRLFQNRLNVNAKG